MLGMSTEHKVKQAGCEMFEAPQPGRQYSNMLMDTPNKDRPTDSLRYDMNATI